MKIKIQFGAIMRGEELFQKLRVAEVPAGLASRMRKNIKAVFAEINVFNELKNEKIKLYGQTLDNGDISVVEGTEGHKSMMEFIKGEYTSESIIETPYDIFTDELGSISNINISVDDLDYLEAIGFTIDPEAKDEVVETKEESAEEVSDKADEAVEG